ncbi:outer membrane lipoprotein chaperone LolA [Diaphorobacter aerolatus]|uniref:Outer-membrane lipoprotein carrier protein n=2 Tax=Diaphorobacter aerolatus TaxID=1288495 RepID=A0A7H0GQ86_9BURK|nr:outer membrane lipoprotein chaperone LolA [Diaphorobacter aerolatus]
MTTKRLITTMVLAACAQVASADGMQSLEGFMKGAKSGRADFTQTVTAPSKDGQQPKVKTSTGNFEFQRPGRFRFDYRRPFEQTIVADGKTLWLHDIDLNQVTQRAQSQALGSTPAALLASAPDLSALKADFNLSSAPDQDGLQWVVAEPKAKEGQIKSVRVGFAGETLATLDILDNFGQRSVLTFTNMQVNTPLAPTAFQFKPPANADVVKQ